MQTYLTKLKIEDVKLMVDFYQLHGFIYSLFPEEFKYKDRIKDEGSILYRLERGRSSYVLIQSKIAPLWGETKMVTINPQPADHYWFRLRANVSRRRASDRKRMGILNMNEQMDWLHRKSQSSGFDLISASITDCPGMVYSTREDPDYKIPLIAITPVTFEGSLRVRDSALFDQTLRSGIGPGKGFGCGLLSLAPA